MEHTKNFRNERGILLTRDTYYQLVHDLWRSLPPPVSDHPDDLVCRDNAAMAEVASLLPADPAEAALAVQFVAACAHAMDCLRLVNEHRAAFAVSMKCLAQAASMMRQACMARSALLRIQEARWKRAASGISANEPGWSDHGILDRVTGALKQAQANAPDVAPEVLPEAAPEVVPEVVQEVVAEGAAVAGTTEQAVSLRDAHPAAASERPEAAAGNLSSAQAVSFHETIFGNRANETPARFGSPGSPFGDPRNSLPALRPPHQPNHRPAAQFGLISTAFAPFKRQLLASVAFTDAMTRAPHPAGTMPQPRAA